MSNDNSLFISLCEETAELVLHWRSRGVYAMCAISCG